VRLCSEAHTRTNCSTAEAIALTLGISASSKRRRWPSSSGGLSGSSWPKPRATTSTCIAETATRYLRERYAENADARFGIVASSKDKELGRFGISNDYQATKRVKMGPWYGDGDGSPCLADS